MNIEALGEFGLIERIRKQVQTDRSVIAGIGDDCAVLALDKRTYQLFTCDMVVEGVDFTRRDDPMLVGRRAVAVCVSDIAACGGLPRHCCVSLGLPRGMRVAAVDRLYKGITSLAREFGFNVVGGDISRARSLTVDVSMLGSVPRAQLVLRSNARPGDILFATGSFGGSIRGKHLRFTPRLAEARLLTEGFRVHAMIDVSDGLLADLGHILDQSKVGVILYEDLIPVNPGCSIDDALTQGEDFELLFTLGLSDARRLRRVRGDFTAIGQIVPARYGATLVDANGRKKALRPRGFTHF